MIAGRAAGVSGCLYPIDEADEFMVDGVDVLLLVLLLMLPLTVHRRQSGVVQRPKPAGILTEISLEVTTTLEGGRRVDDVTLVKTSQGRGTMTQYRPIGRRALSKGIKSPINLVAVTVAGLLVPDNDIAQVVIVNQLTLPVFKGDLCPSHCQSIVTGKFTKDCNVPLTKGRHQANP